MVTLLIVLGVSLAAIAIAAVANRRTPDAPSTPKFAVPQQLDRADFAEPSSPWLLALFTSATCLACHDARDTLAPVKLANLASLAVQEVPFEQNKLLHERYGIDGVPTVVLADADGVVTWSYLGAPPPEAIAELLVDAGLTPPETGTSVDLG